MGGEMDESEEEAYGSWFSGGCWQFPKQLTYRMGAWDRF